jgi:hypothetical protein
MKSPTLNPWSTISALELLGDIEDGEHAAARLGLIDLAQLLRSAKRSLAEKIAKADANRRRLSPVPEPSSGPEILQIPIRPCHRRPASLSIAPGEVVDARSRFRR